MVHHMRVASLPGFAMQQRGRKSLPALESRRHETLFARNQLVIFAADQSAHAAAVPATAKDWFK
jgi:hypothetical protein